MGLGLSCSPGRNRIDADFDGIGSVQVKNGLGVEGGSCEKDHPRHEDQHQEGREFAELLEEVPGEEWIFRVGEVVDEGSQEDDESEDQGCQSSRGLPRVAVAAGVESVQEDGEPGHVQEGPHEIQVLELLPLGETVGSRVARWEVDEERADEGEGPVARGDVVHDTPTRVGQQGVCEEGTRDGPTCEVEFGPRQAHAAVLVG